MNLRIFTLSFDTRVSGPGCSVYPTATKLYARLVELMNEDNAPERHPRLQELLDAEDIDQAWAYWQDECRDSNDSYSEDEHELEMPLSTLPGVRELVTSVEKLLNSDHIITQTRADWVKYRAVQAEVWAALEALQEREQAAAKGKTL